MVMTPDEFAVETALNIGKPRARSHMLTVGGPCREDSRYAKAIGVDHIVRIDADGEMDSNALQTPSTGRQ